MADRSGEDPESWWSTVGEAARYLVTGQRISAGFRRSQTRPAPYESRPSEEGREQTPRRGQRVAVTHMGRCTQVLELGEGGQSYCWAELASDGRCPLHGKDPGMTFDAAAVG